MPLRALPRTTRATCARSLVAEERVLRTPVAEGERRLALRGPLPPGRSVAAPAIRGYYIDFRVKTSEPVWPPPWFPWPGFHRFMGVAQWGLGAYERFLAGEGDAWLGAAAAAAEHLVEQQDGAVGGGWREPIPYVHTFRTGANWLSAMTQGQCASLLARVGQETDDERFLDAAQRALHPLRVPISRGGVQAPLGDGIFLEEYPTDPPSHVLNGGIFALWGAYDVWRTLDDDAAERLFVEATATLAANLRRWDTGFWSRYDLYPHPIRNVASPSYHTLHIDQLTVLNALAPAAPFAETAARFIDHSRSPIRRARSVAHKVAFRAVVRRRLPRPDGTDTTGVR